MRLLCCCLCVAAAEAGRVCNKDEGARREGNAMARGLASGVGGKGTTTVRSAGKDESEWQWRWQLRLSE